MHTGRVCECGIVLALLLIGGLVLGRAEARSTAFTYQGQLKHNGLVRPLE